MRRNAFRALLEECGWVRVAKAKNKIVWIVPVDDLPEDERPWFADSFTRGINVNDVDHITKLMQGLYDLLEIEPKSGPWVFPLLERLGIQAPTSS